MSSTSLKGSEKRESKPLRAAKALPFFAITVAAMYCMWGLTLEPVVARATELMEKGIVSGIGKPGYFMPLRELTGVKFIDSRVAPLAACFGSFQFVDVICHWQTYSFLTDLGIIYAVVLIESARQSNRMTILSLPILLGYYMQFFGIGVLMALYCFIHYVQSPVEKFGTTDMRLTNQTYTSTVLPILFLAHYIPNYLAFSSFLEPLTRHKWEWIWQPFPVVASVLQILLAKTIMPTNSESEKTNASERGMSTIKYTILTLCAISTATWHYTVFFSPKSLFELFVPNLAAAQSGDEFIRLFLQFDEIFSMSACFLWLLYLFGDMKKAGMADASWLSIFGRGLVTFVFAGPGVTVGLGWLWRETVLAKIGHEETTVKTE